jgi:hypothetical protein
MNVSAPPIHLFVTKDRVSLSFSLLEEVKIEKFFPHKVTILYRISRSYSLCDISLIFIAQDSHELLILAQLPHKINFGDKGLALEFGVFWS